MSQAGEYSGGTVGQGGDVGQLALSAADLHDELVGKVVPLVTATSDERQRAGAEGLADLRAKGILTEPEAQQLGNILRALGAGDLSPAQRAQVIDDALPQLQTAEAGPVALTIASIAASTARGGGAIGEEGRSLDVAADIGDFSTAGECACAGGIAGATAGALLGGPAGALLGAAAGAAGGAIGFAVAEALLSE